MPRNRLTAVDLFAGAGGFSLAAIKSGFDIVFAVENDPHSAQTYRENICKNYSSVDTTLYENDIEGLDPSKLASTHFGKEMRCDVLLGGPPCQGFSTHRILNAGVDDPRNKLIHTYFDFVRALRPRFFLLENVPGILWPRHQKYLKRFYREGKQSNYHLYAPIKLDARDLGIPQRRRRVFILGVDQDLDITNLDWPPAVTHGSPNAIEIDQSLQSWNSCRFAFSRAPAGDPNNVHMKHGQELILAFKNTPKNGGSRKDSGRLLPCHSDHDGHKDTYGRIDSFLPAPTMTTACINPSKGRFVHPTRNHGITARQAARIQTFPDDFQFEGGLIASGRQIGNAVPIALGEALLGVIVDELVSSGKSNKSYHTTAIERLAQV